MNNLNPRPNLGPLPTRSHVVSRVVYNEVFEMLCKYADRGIIVDIPEGRTVSEMNGALRSAMNLRLKDPTKTVWIAKIDDDQMFMKIVDARAAEFRPGPKKTTLAERIASGEVSKRTRGSGSKATSKWSKKPR